MPTRWRRNKPNTLLYPNGLLVAKVLPQANKTITYTKYYYIGARRLASRTGSMENLGLYPKGIEVFFPSLNVDFLRDAANQSVTNAGQIVQNAFNEFEIGIVLPNPVVEGTIVRYLHDASLLKTYYFHTDHLGSSNYITNLAGIVTQHLEYLPFGEMLVEEHLNSNNEPFKFNGKELDEETGNYYYGARYYNPKWSMWLSVDPMAEKYPGWSPYNYTLQNPVNYTDPDGRTVDGDYYDKQGNYLGNDGIDDDKVYTVEGTSKFNVNDFGESGKYYNNEVAYNENNGDGFSVTYEGQISDVFKTWDPVTDKRIVGLHPAIRMKATNFINDTESDLGIQLRISTGFRDNNEQESLYWQSRDGSGRPWATNARAGESYHNYGLAVDVVEILNGNTNWNSNWTGISEIGKSQGFMWGGDWKKSKDRPHFEMNFGNSTRSLSQKPLLSNGFKKL